MSHTPGPWHVLPEECDKSYIRIRGTRLGGRYKIANVLTPTYDGVDSLEAEETRANACLISAAPDLLEACERLLRECVWASIRAEIVTAVAKADLEFARTALAKARGQS